MKLFFGLVFIVRIFNDDDAQMTIALNLMCEFLSYFFLLFFMIDFS